MLPEAVYAVARKMQDVWNNIAQHNADAYVAWKVGKKEDEKPGKDFYKANDEWATQYVKDAALPDELGTKILDRLHATFKRNTGRCPSVKVWAFALFASFVASDTGSFCRSRSSAARPGLVLYPRHSTLVLHTGQWSLPLALAPSHWRYSA